MRDRLWDSDCDGSLQFLGQFPKTAELSTGLNDSTSTFGPENTAFEHARIGNAAENSAYRLSREGVQLISTSDGQGPLSPAITVHVAADNTCLYKLPSTRLTDLLGLVS